MSAVISSKLIDAAPELGEGLKKAVATLDDLQRVLRLIGRHTLADACLVAADASRDVLDKAGLLGPAPVTCDDCEAVIDTVTDPNHIIKDPWLVPTGEKLCENCREKRWDRQQERLLEET